MIINAQNKHEEDKGDPKISSTSASEILKLVYEGFHLSLLWDSFLTTWRQEGDELVPTIEKKKELNGTSACIPSVTGGRTGSQD